MRMATPGPWAATVPASTDSASSWSWAALVAASSWRLDVWSVSSCSFKVAISSCRASVSELRDARMRARSPSLSASRRWVKRCWPRNWLTRRKPTTAATNATARRPATAPLRPRRDTSAPEHPAADGGQVLEDAHAEHHHDRGREVDAQLVAHPHEQGGDEGVGHEGDHEDAVVERALEVGPGAAEGRVEGGDDRHGQVPRQVLGHARLEEHGEQRTDQQAEDGQHP